MTLKLRSYHLIHLFRFRGVLQGFTVAEYADLFNIHISVEDYAFFPVFAQFRKKKGGIVSAKQRAYIQSLLSQEEDSYIKALELAGLEPLLQAFFGDVVAYKARLPLKKLLTHAYISASTGSGKSELIRVIFREMILNFDHASFVLIDPHGSLAESCKKLQTIGGFKERVVYIDPFLKEGFTPVFNPFEIKDTSIKNITFTAEQFILAMEEVLSRSGGEFTEVQMNALEKSVYFLLQRKQSTMQDLVSVLKAESPIFEEAQAYDSHFFDKEFAKPSNRTRKALTDRVDRLLNSPIQKLLFGGSSTFDLEKILNTEGKILIFNLGELSEQTQISMSKFLIASIKSIIRKRKKNNGQATFLLVDEAHIMVSGSIEYMLSQLRGFGLHVLLANQYLNQLGEQAESVRQNCAVKIVASDDFSEMNKVIPIPKETPLKDYEFFLKVRGYPVQIFKSPDFLLNDPSTYEINAAQEADFDAYQLEHYYQAYGDSNTLITKDLPNEPTPPSNEGESSAPKPPFQIDIDE